MADGDPPLEAAYELCRCGEPDCPTCGNPRAYVEEMAATETARCRYCGATEELTNGACDRCHADADGSR